MNHVGRTCWCVSVFFLAGPAWGQWGGTVPSSQFELADTVQLDQVDNTVLAQWERVKALLADRQWDEAVEILRQLAESSEGKLLGVTNRRYVSLPRVVPIAVGRLAARGPETLSRPRRSGRPEMVRARDRRAEPPAVAKRRRAGVCQQVWRQCPDGSRRDGAGVGRLCRGTLVLGADRAGSEEERSCWDSRNSRPSQNARPLQWAKAGRWPAYPDTDLDLAAVRARLVLVSILEGATDRAQAGTGTSSPGCTPTRGVGWAARKGSTPSC